MFARIRADTQVCPYVGLDDEIMVGHETEGMDSISVFLYTFLEQEIEAITVRGRKEEVLSPIASSYKTHAFFRIALFRRHSSNCACNAGGILSMSSSP